MCISLFLANITNFLAPLPPAPHAEMVGGHYKVAFLLLVVLFSITYLDMMYFLRKIFPPSEVLEVRIYSHLQCFKGGKSAQQEGGNYLEVGIWQRVILTIWIFLKARNNILLTINIYLLKSKLAWPVCTKTIKLNFGWWVNFPPFPNRKNPDV